MLRRMQHVEVQRFFPAPIEAVWERYTDHRAWTRYTGLAQVTLQPEGHPSPNGVGCVRSFTVGGLEMVAEEVLEFDAPTRMKYHIVRRGGPLRDHEGEVLFTPEADGTRVTWRCRFSTVPGLGWLLRVGIGGFFRYVLRGVASELKATEQAGAR